MGHHNVFHFIRRADRILLWINNLFLLCVVFIPFPTVLIRRYGRQQITVVIYGATLLVTGLVLYTLWWYATSGHRMVESELDPRLVHMASGRILAAPLVSLLAIGISFFSINEPTPLHLDTVLYILPGRIDRHWTKSERKVDQPQAPANRPPIGLETISAYMTSVGRLAL